MKIYAEKNVKTCQAGQICSKNIVRRDTEVIANKLVFSNIIQIKLEIHILKLKTIQKHYTLIL